MRFVFHDYLRFLGRLCLCILLHDDVSHFLLFDFDAKVEGLDGFLQRLDLTHFRLRQRVALGVIAYPYLDGFKLLNPVEHDRQVEFEYRFDCHHLASVFYLQEICEPLGRRRSLGNLRLLVQFVPVGFTGATFVALWGIII